MIRVPPLRFVDVLFDSLLKDISVHVEGYKLSIYRHCTLLNIASVSCCSSRCGPLKDGRFHLKDRTIERRFRCHTPLALRYYLAVYRKKVSPSAELTIDVAVVLYDEDFRLLLYRREAWVPSVNWCILVQSRY